MYPSGLARPVIEPLAVADEAPHWACVLDADRQEPERVSAAWRLAGAHDLETVGRRLAAILREPTLWLGSEIVEVLRTIAADLAFGVDENGLVAVSATPLTKLAAGACPVLGHVVSATSLRALAGRTADMLPWLVEPRDVEAIAIVAFRPYLTATSRQRPRMSAAVAKAEEWIGEFPWRTEVVRIGDVIELVNAHVHHRACRVTLLDEHRCGVLSYFEAAARVLDLREEHRKEHFRYFSTYAMGGAFRFRVNRPADDREANDGSA